MSDSRSRTQELSGRFLLACYSCSTCNGYYGPSFGQPVCATCHAFLYANDLDAEINIQIMSEEHDPGEDDADSGNDEPNDFYTYDRRQSRGGGGGLGGGGGREEGDGNGLDVGEGGADDEDNQSTGPEANGAVGGEAESDEPNGVGDAVVASAETAPPDASAGASTSALENGEGGVVALYMGEPMVISGDLPLPPSQPQPSKIKHRPNPHRIGSIHVESLSERLALLSSSRIPDKVSGEIFDAIPPEVLMLIFSYLDDISLYAVGHVCRRWYQLLRSSLSTETWQIFTRRRWPLFRPIAKVKDWFSTYSALIESSYCLTCIYQMAEVIPADVDSLPLRGKRLGHDLRNLVQDPLEGIKAQPLDSSYYHWQASMTGPVGSPYEGGMFFLYLKVPFTYPWDPPEVRFLTRIFHPNVSRHGDVGIDLIQEYNWSSSLTIPKVLISIQSLLTDPYTDVCMEPEIGLLHRRDRKLFDAIARSWTWKFAIHDAIPPSPKRNI